MSDSPWEPFSFRQKNHFIFKTTIDIGIGPIFDLAIRLQYGPGFADAVGFPHDSGIAGDVIYIVAFIVALMVGTFLGLKFLYH